MPEVGGRIPAIPSRGTPSESLAKLLNLFYALAISTGFGGTVRDLVAQPEKLTPFAAWALAWTFLISLSDWVIFHFAIAPWAHLRLTRLLLDLAFPVLLFLLAMTPRHPSWLLLLLAMYFLLSAGYARLAAGEGLREMPGWNGPLALAAYFLCGLVDAGLQWGIAPAWSRVAALTVVSMAWVFSWLGWLRGALRRQAQRRGWAPV